MFKIKYKERDARTGVFKTRNYNVKTPFFMPVCTKGAPKYLTLDDLKTIGVECFISNSLITYFKPGLELLKEKKGFGKFINWKRAFFTDSGGFQTMKDSLLMKTDERGAYFKNPWDGKTMLITPEDAMKIQGIIGSDVAMCLDDVPVYSNDYDYVKEKMERTHKWAKRCKEEHDKNNKHDGQFLFGICQGGLYEDLRLKSIEYIKKLDFDGFAVGGLAIGEPIKKMYDLLRKVKKKFPKDKVVYLMGVGAPEDIIEAVSLGVDCFDSTFPARNARHGTLFTFEGKLKITNKKYEDDFSPIEESCKCPVCKKHSRAYIRHLLKTKEPTGKILATMHNQYFMQEFMRQIRKSIKEQKFEEFKKDFLERFK